MVSQGDWHRVAEPRPAGAVVAELQLLNVRQVATSLAIHTRSAWRLASLAEAGHGDLPKPLRIGPKTVRWRLCRTCRPIWRLWRERGASELSGVRQAILLKMRPDAARALLGHRSLGTTDAYAELDQALAVEAARKLGWRILLP